MFNFKPQDESSAILESDEVSYVVLFESDLYLACQIGAALIDVDICVFY